MCQLSRLKYLRLEYCHRLQSLSELPSGSDLYVDVANCTSLVALSDPIKQCNSGISANCLNCFKLVEKKWFKSMTLSLLIGYLQEPKTTPKSPYDEYCRFDFVAPAIEIPEWFNHQSVGSSVSIELHPGWFSSKWMGFALCAVFADKELSSVCSDAMIVCKLKVNGEEYLFPEPSLPHGEKWGQAVSDHLWLLYVPAHRYFKNDWQDIYYKLEFSFWFKHFAQGCEALEMGEVKKCGIYMVYKKDVEKLKQRYWQGNASISEETLEFPECDFQNAAVITAAVSGGIITNRALEHYGSDGEAGPSSAGSACIHQEQEPCRKRLKQLDDGAGPGGNA
ncbi:disease resistance protein RPS4B-like isoform X1 [Rosa rugosa]|uniref:disease resistance protein RPS4B-like isoform X1 n=1 Tax=Rosa rugosa TaxID=74645 RepID=UPI002B412B09|nr:disease resistance protein RPS4B-like isoform X1 [Rosa rugosa]